MATTEEMLKLLEEESKRLQARVLKEKWEVYLTNMKARVIPLIGKVLVTHIGNGRFIMYKVLDVKERSYSHQVNSLTHPERWLELIITEYLSFSVADNKDKWLHNVSIDNPDYEYFKFIFLDKKNKLNISKIKLLTNNTKFPDDIFKIGYTEFEEYREDPDWNRALSDRFLFTYILEDETIYDKALEIHYDHVNKTKEFWLEYQDGIMNKNLKKVLS